MIYKQKEIEMIRLICGSTRIGDEIFTPKSSAFSADSEIEKRLVALGVAEYEGVLKYHDNKDTKDIPANNPESVGKSTGNENKDDFEDPGDDDDLEDLSGDDSEDDTPEYSEENTKAELQAIASEWGIEIPGNASKAQILEILDDYFGNAPELSAKEPE